MDLRRLLDSNSHPLRPAQSVVKDDERCGLTIYKRLQFPHPWPEGSTPDSGVNFLQPVKFSFVLGHDMK